MLVQRKGLVLIFLIIGLALVFLISAGKGAMYISPMQVVSIILKKIGWEPLVSFETGQENVLWAIRLPRVMLGMLVGAALAVSGAAMQGLYRNPLADPGLIGISSGASLCAVIAIVLLSTMSQFSGLSGYYVLNFATFLGAAAASFVVYSLSRSGGKTVVTTMLLAGIAVRAICESLNGLIISYFANDAQLRNITFWSLGSLGGASWEILTGMLPFVLVPIYLLPRHSKSLNAFALGESEAAHLGINTDRLKTQIVLLSTMAIGASVAVAGSIGFVGLIVPHIIRLAAGPDNRFVMVASSLLGAILLLSADLLCRTLIAPAELPIGILTALGGTPVFLWILLKRKKEMKIS